MMAGGRDKTHTQWLLIDLLHFHTTAARLNNDNAHSRYEQEEIVFQNSTLPYFPHFALRFRMTDKVQVKGKPMRNVNDTVYAIVRRQRAACVGAGLERGMLYPLH